MRRQPLHYEATFLSASRPVRLFGATRPLDPLDALNRVRANYAMLAAVLGHNREKIAVRWDGERLDAQLDVT